MGSHFCKVGHAALSWSLRNRPQKLWLYEQEDNVKRAPQRISNGPHNIKCKALPFFQHLMHISTNGNKKTLTTEVYQLSRSYYGYVKSNCINVFPRISLQLLERNSKSSCSSSFECTIAHVGPCTILSRNPCKKLLKKKIRTYFLLQKTFFCGTDKFHSMWPGHCCQCL